jgi:hypothetical protein
MKQIILESKHEIYRCSRHGFEIADLRNEQKEGITEITTEKAIAIMVVIRWSQLSCLSLSSKHSSKDSKL